MADLPLTIFRNRRMKKSIFYNFLRDSHPSRVKPYDGSDLRSAAMHYAIENRYRFFLVLDYFLKHFALKDAVVVDLGTYPGSFLRLLHRFAPIKLGRLYGVGLNVSPEFIADMLQDCSAIIFEVNLDPANPDISGRNFGNKIPMDEGSVNYIYAGEVIEHLVNPSWMLQEASRILMPGGCMVITTPNVCRIGNIFKLLIGRTNYDRLQPIGNQAATDEWRAHFREYSLEELIRMFCRNGFKIKYRRHYNSKHYNSREFSLMNFDMGKQLIELFKAPFYLVPHLQGDILAVFEKK